MDKSVYDAITIILNKKLYEKNLISYNAYLQVEEKILREMSWCCGFIENAGKTEYGISFARFKIARNLLF